MDGVDISIFLYRNGVGMLEATSKLTYSTRTEIKIFLWRVCLKTLPTQLNLAKRKMIENVICSHCKREAETEIHALWFFKSIKTYRSRWSPMTKIQQMTHVDFFPLFCTAKEELSTKDLRVFSFVNHVESLKLCSFQQKRRV